MAMRVGISIVSMNRPQILRQTISRLTCNPRIPQGRIVIVDNGSTDPETLRLLETQEREGWHIIRNASNLGLSKAVNQGLGRTALARGEHLGLSFDSDVLLHLDDDALMPADDGWLDRMLDTMANCPELGLLLPNGHGYSEFIAHDRYRELRWGLGFCWLLRRETYELIGGYDPGLLHQQECDFALRVRMAGYTVGAATDFQVTHNDPQIAPPSELSNARLHLGCVQFADKWCEYFRGRGWNYGTIPVYRMQQWPPDQEWYRRFAKENKIDLNPPPPEHRAEQVQPGDRVMQIVEVTDADPHKPSRLIFIGDTWYVGYIELRNEYAHWARGTGYLDDRDRAIAKWFELTGEKYEGYRWPFNPLKPDNS